jgi:tRNA A37 threonylcarbamoyladenosine biosynthesis protein TsaE
MKKMSELNGDDSRVPRMTYSLLAQRLRARGFNLSHLDVFMIADRRKEADKDLQEAIADILGCLRKDIF